MKMLLLISLLAVALPACTVHPFLYSDGKREVASLGGSVLTRSKAETLRVMRADGTLLESATWEKNETSVPVMQGMVGLGGSLLNEAPGVIKSVRTE